MPAVDVVSLIQKLPLDSATSREALGDLAGWGSHEENTARLLEIMAYRLDLEWIDRTTDPDDPEVKRDRAAAKRAGVKPPPRPIVPPIALRPRSLAEEHAERYSDEIAAHHVKKTTPTSKASTRASFEASWGIES